MCDSANLHPCLKQFTNISIHFSTIFITIIVYISASSICMDQCWMCASTIGVNVCSNGMSLALAESQDWKMEYSFWGFYDWQKINLNTHSAKQASKCWAHRLNDYWSVKFTWTFFSLSHKKTLFCSWQHNKCYFSSLFFFFLWWNRAVTG